MTVILNILGEVSTMAHDAPAPPSPRSSVAMIFPFYGTWVIVSHDTRDELHHPNMEKMQWCLHVSSNKFSTTIS